MKVQILVVVIGIRKEEKRYQVYGTKRALGQNDYEQEIKMSPRIILKGAGSIFFLCNIKTTTTI